MDMAWLWAWALCAAVLLVGEMLSTSFFLLPFALGAIAAFIANLFYAPLGVQWIIFIVVSVISLVLLRPVAQRMTRKEETKSNVDRLIGKTGTVVEYDEDLGISRMRVEREIWSVKLEDGSAPTLNSSVEVLGVDGTRLIVKYCASDSPVVEG